MLVQIFFGTHFGCNLNGVIEKSQLTVTYPPIFASSNSRPQGVCTLHARIVCARQLLEFQLHTAINSLIGKKIILLSQDRPPYSPIVISSIFTRCFLIRSKRSEDLHSRRNKNNLVIFVCKTIEEGLPNDSSSIIFFPIS